MRELFIPDEIDIEELRTDVLLHALDDYERCYPLNRYQLFADVATWPDFAAGYLGV